MSENLPTGKSLLIDVKDCLCESLLNSPNRLIQILSSAAHKAGATVMGFASQTYAPQGVTVVVFLAESHIAINTYPEWNGYMLDVFTCGQIDPRSIAQAITNVLPGEVIERGLIARESG